jgi:hypothetical protein
MSTPIHGLTASTLVGMMRVKSLVNTMGRVMVSGKPVLTYYGRFRRCYKNAIIKEHCDDRIGPTFAKGRLIRRKSKVLGAE